MSLLPGVVEVAPQLARKRLCSQVLGLKALAGSEDKSEPGGCVASRALVNEIPERGLGRALETVLDFGGVSLKVLDERLPIWVDVALGALRADRSRAASTYKSDGSMLAQHTKQ